MTPVKDHYTSAELEQMRQEAIHQMRQMHNRSQQRATSGEQVNSRQGADTPSHGGKSQSSSNQHSSGSGAGTNHNVSQQGKSMPQHQQHTSSQRNTNRNNRQNNNNSYNQRSSRPIFPPLFGTMPNRVGNQGSHYNQRTSPRYRTAQARGQTAPPRQEEREERRQEYRPPPSSNSSRPPGGSGQGNQGFDLNQLLSSLGLGGQGGNGTTEGLFDGLIGPDGINLFEKDSLLLLGLLYFLHREGAELKLLLALGYILL